ncbi:MAG: sugar ABC transporter ATP-binding protein [bacterium]
MQPLLQMLGISKAFPGVQALDDVSLDVAAGEVVALVGENGAGKSTLIKILSGCYRADAGEVLLDGEALGHYSPQRAQQLGISVIYQEFNLAASLSVAENIFVGRQPRTRLGFVDFRRMAADAQAVVDSLALPLDVRRPVRSLSVAEQQMVEIAKAISCQARLIVMDEPTAVLSEHETATLFALVRRLRERGVSVIYISHRLEEIFDVADRVVVLRDGQRVGAMPIAEARVEGVVALMVGRELTEMFHKQPVAVGEPVLEVRGLSRAESGVRDVALTVRAGEIVGMAGLVGAGRTEIARALFGVDRPDAGRIAVCGRPVRIRSPLDAIRSGMGFVTEDRKEQGLFLGLAVRENVASASLRHLSTLAFIRFDEERRRVGALIDQLRIRTPSQEQEVQLLSGGNQQKVVLARWLALRPKVLVLDEPTRGIDVGAKAEIYDLMGELARDGVGILMISSELPEVLGMSDRVLVVRQGTIVAEFDRRQATQEAIIHRATGGR